MGRLLWLLLLIPVLPAVGMIYQWIGALNDRRRFIGLGRLVEVGDGRQVYVSDMGRQEWRRVRRSSSSQVSRRPVRTGCACRSRWPASRGPSATIAADWAGAAPARPSAHRQTSRANCGSCCSRRTSLALTCWWGIRLEGWSCGAMRPCIRRTFKAWCWWIRCAPRNGRR